MAFKHDGKFKGGLPAVVHKHEPAGATHAPRGGAGGEHRSGMVNPALEKYAATHGHHGGGMSNPALEHYAAEHHTGGGDLPIHGSGGVKLATLHPDGNATIHAMTYAGQAEARAAIDKAKADRASGPPLPRSPRSSW